MPVNVYRFPLPTTMQDNRSDTNLQLLPIKQVCGQQPGDTSDTPVFSRGQGQALGWCAGEKPFAFPICSPCAAQSNPPPTSTFVDCCYYVLDVILAPVFTPVSAITNLNSIVFDPCGKTYGIAAGGNTIAEMQRNIIERFNRLYYPSFAVANGDGIRFYFNRFELGCDPSTNTISFLSDVGESNPLAGSIGEISTDCKTGIAPPALQPCKSTFTFRMAEADFGAVGWLPDVVLSCGITIPMGQMKADILGNSGTNYQFAITAVSAVFSLYYPNSDLIVYLDYETNEYVFRFFLAPSDFPGCDCRDFIDVEWEFSNITLALTEPYSCCRFTGDDFQRCGTRVPVNLPCDIPPGFARLKVMLLNDLPEGTGSFQILPGFMTCPKPFIGCIPTEYNTLMYPELKFFLEQLILFNSGDFGASFVEWVNPTFTNRGIYVYLDLSARDWCRDTWSVCQCDGDVSELNVSLIVECCPEDEPPTEATPCPAGFAKASIRLQNNVDFVWGDPDNDAGFVLRGLLDSLGCVGLEFEDIPTELRMSNASSYTDYLQKVYNYLRSIYETQGNTYLTLNLVTGTITFFLDIAHWARARGLGFDLCTRTFAICEASYVADAGCTDVPLGYGKFSLTFTAPSSPIATSEFWIGDYEDPCFYLDLDALLEGETDPVVIAATFAAYFIDGVYSAWGWQVSYTVGSPTVNFLIPLKNACCGLTAGFIARDDEFEVNLLLESDEIQCCPTNCEAEPGFAILVFVVKAEKIFEFGNPNTDASFTLQPLSEECDTEIYVPLSIADASDSIEYLNNVETWVSSFVSVVGGGSSYIRSEGVFSLSVNTDEFFDLYGIDLCESGYKICKQSVEPECRIKVTFTLTYIDNGTWSGQFQVSCGAAFLVEFNVSCDTGADLAEFRANLIDELHDLGIGVVAYPHPENANQLIFEYPCDLLPCSCDTVASVRMITLDGDSGSTASATFTCLYPVAQELDVELIHNWCCPSEGGGGGEPQELNWLVEGQPECCPPDGCAYADFEITINSLSANEDDRAGFAVVHFDADCPVELPFVGDDFNLIFDVPDYSTFDSINAFLQSFVTTLNDPPNVSASVTGDRLKIQYARSYFLETYGVDLCTLQLKICPIGSINCYIKTKIKLQWNQEAPFGITLKEHCSEGGIDPGSDNDLLSVGVPSTGSNTAELVSLWIDAFNALGDSYSAYNDPEDPADTITILNPCLGDCPCEESTILYWYSSTTFAATLTHLSGECVLENNIISSFAGGITQQPECCGEECGKPCPEPDHAIVKLKITENGAQYGITAPRIGFAFDPSFFPCPENDNVLPTLYLNHPMHSDFVGYWTNSVAVHQSAWAGPYGATITVEFPSATEAILTFKVNRQMWMDRFGVDICTDGLKMCPDLPTRPPVMLAEALSIECCKPANDCPDVLDPPDEEPPFWDICCDQPDVLFFQFSIPDAVNDYRTAPTAGWSSEAQGNWFATVRVIGLNGQVVTMPSFAVKYYVGRNSKTQTSYQGIQIDTTLLPNCFYLEFRFKTKPETVLYTELYEKTDNCGCEPTILIEGLHGDADCDGRTYLPVDKVLGTYFKHRDLIRLRANVEKTGFNVEVEEVDGKVMKKTTTETYRFRANRLSLNAVSRLQNILSAPVIVIGGERFTFSGSVDKRNEIGAQWFVDFNLTRETSCENDLSCPPKN